MSKERNLAALERFAEGVNTGNLSLFFEAVAPGAIDHDSAPGQGPGPEGYQHFFAKLRAAFPDLKVAVEHMTATDDDLAFAYTITGTQKGPLMGFAPTGKAIKIRGMQISKFVDGKMVERWGSSDQLGMLQQLGLLPAH